MTCDHAMYPWWGLALAIGIPTLLVLAGIALAFWLGGR